MPEGVQQKLKSNQKLNTIYRNKKDRLGIGFKVTADRNTEARAAKLPVQVFENSSDRNGGGIGTHGSIEIGPHTEIVLEASKSLTGRKWKDNDHFEVKLSAEDGAPMPRNYDGDAVETVSFRSDSDSGITEKVQFPEIAYTQPGIYRYSLKEIIPAAQEPDMQYDPVEYEIIVTVNYKKDGDVDDKTKLTTDVQYLKKSNGRSEDCQELLFVNKFGLTSVSTQKVWEDNNNQDGIRPDNITIRLLADGTEVNRKTVSEKDNWSWKFDNLPKYKDGKEIKYTVTEEKIDGYTTDITGNAKDGYLITNTKDTPPSKNLPKTGDSSNVRLFAGLLALSGALLTAIVVRRRKLNEK